MTAISYHETVNDLQGQQYWAQPHGAGPFARRDWFVLLEQAGHKPLLAVASDGGENVCLPLTHGARGLEVLSNWYAFTWRPVVTGMVGCGLLEPLAMDLASRASRIVLTKLPETEADRLEHAFRAAGWRVQRHASDTNHYLPVEERSFADYLATRPGPLRTTLKRKAKKVELRLTRTFDPADWAIYEDIYRQSWKPEEGDPAMLRAFAEQEGAAGHLLFGLAFADGLPVAAQFWTVEQGTAYIHKLAHLPSAEPLSPGTTLTAALLEQVIDCDRVVEVDFGTGNDRYKADWMEQVRPRYTLTCLRPGNPRNWPQLAKWALAALVSPARAG